MIKTGSYWHRGRQTSEAEYEVQKYIHSYIPLCVFIYNQVAVLVLF